MSVGRSYVDTVTVTYFQARVEWYEPADREGWQKTGWVECGHLHRYLEHAERCERRLRAQVNRGRR